MPRAWRACVECSCTRFPAKAPRAVVLVDLGTHSLSTYVGDDVPGAVQSQLERFELIAGVDVRPALEALRFDPGARRLAELGPPQKTMTLNERGRALRITTAMLIQGSCGISRPLGDPDRLHEYLDGGDTTRLVRRLEADAKALFALYRYGLVHGAVRLRWGFLDEMIQAPWSHPDEPRLHDIKRLAHAQRAFVELVAGSAPGWEEPWARARRCQVVVGRTGYDLHLVDEQGLVINDDDVQTARIVT